MRPSIAQLQHATMVATCGSFSAAARRCNVSQPTISNSVSDLEDLLGKRLFRRSTRRVETTPFGEQMLPVIAEAVAAVDRVTAEAEARINPQRKLLRIAYTPLLDIGQVDAICAGFRLANPEVEIVYKECAHESLEARLLAEQIDIVFAHDVPKQKEFRRCSLYLDPLHYVPATGRSDAAGGTVPLAAVVEAQLLLTEGSCGLAPTTLKLLETNGFVPQLYAGRAMTHASLRDWAELGLGGAILPYSKLMPTPEAFPRVEVDGTPQRIEFQAVWAKASEATDHLQRFFKQIPQAAAALVQSGALGGRQARAPRQQPHAHNQA